MHNGKPVFACPTAERVGMRREFDGPVHWPPGRPLCQGLNLNWQACRGSIPPCRGALHGTRHHTHRTVYPRTPAETVARLPSLYTLTSICPVEYTNRVESGFEIIAKPNRRAILILLVLPKRLAGEIERQLRMPQPADAWLAPFHRAWSVHVDALERHLDLTER
jgi:hypothetical protein